MQHRTGEKKIRIEAELPIALEELAFSVLSKREDPSAVVDLLIKKPEVASRVLERVVRRIIRKKEIAVRLKNLAHDYNDSHNITHGVAYFKAELEGTEQELRKITGANRLMQYDWTAVKEEMSMV